MTVSIETTSKKYRGKKAATYEAVRKKQIRWDLENKYVEEYLSLLAPRSVLDVPVGTGRFFHVYKKLQVERVAGVDSSDEMLSLAMKKLRGQTLVRTDGRGFQTYTGGGKMEWLLEQGDARKLDGFKNFDVGVVVRFLDLIDERAMRDVMKAVCGRCAAVILTIRFGRKYVPKVNTAEHDEKKFLALVRRLGFVVSRRDNVFKAGWTVMLLSRRTK